jgi:hypothetical protein
MQTMNQALADATTIDQKLSKRTLTLILAAMSSFISIVNKG